jgi:protein-disulfide isomerase
MADLRSAAPEPVTEADHQRGDPAAPLVIVYADFTCVHCAVAHERLRAAPIREVFRHFALRSRHPRSLALACAAEAAANQGAFWPMHDSLFEDQAHIDDPHLWARATDLHLDIERFERDRRDPEVLAKVKAQVRAAMRAGIATTPTLVVGGRPHPGPPDEVLIARLAGHESPESTHPRSLS